MKREFIYERRQTAGRMEAVMLGVTAAALVGALFAFLNYGWLPSLGLLILGSVAFGLSQIFDLLGDLFAWLNELDGSRKPRATEDAQSET